jgi:hypothetical protein
MARTPQQIKEDFFAVLHSSVASASVAVRDALGGGAASVIVREELNKASLPEFPFVALQWPRGGGPRNRGVKHFYPIWFLYDQSIYRYSRLDPLVALIEAAYPEDAITMCDLDFIETRELREDALNLPAKSFPFHIKTRG